MRRLLLTALLGAFCLSMSGCWFFDAKHNRKHYKIIKEDVRLLHQDIDWLLLLDKESVNDSYYR